MNKTLISLVPVIHTRYLDLFKKYPNELYILGESVLKNWERHKNLHRDLRRVDQNMIADFIKKSGLVKKVAVLEENILDELKGKAIVMPDEDVSRWFAETYLKDENVNFEPIFIRWNKSVSTVEMEIPPDREITEDDFHEEMMGKAVEISQKSANWWRQIGTLAIKDGKILLEGFNAHVPTQQNIEVYGDLRSDFDAGEHHELSNSIHGEAFLISSAAKKGISLDGADLYVTTFPCPTCAKLIANAGIKTVYYKDGYSLADAEDILKNADVEIVLVK
ncbi:MAG: deoxycytidylate deaminase [Bacteriovoracia bacterium]